MYCMLDRGLFTCAPAPAAAAVLQVFNSLCIVTEPVTKHISQIIQQMWGWLASSSFDVTLEFLDSTCAYLHWLTMEAANCEILFAELSVNKPVVASQVNLTSKEREWKQRREMGPSFSVSCRNQWHWDGIGADVRWRSCAINKGLGEVISNLATVFLFVTSLRKQLPSQEGLGIGRQKFKGNSRVMGWKRQQAGGDLVGSGLLLSPAVLSLSFLTEGQSQVRRPPRRKERERRGGSNTGYRLEESVWGVESVCIWVCMCVFCDSTQSSTPLPCSHTHTGTAWPDVPLASDIFICSEQSLLREGDPRDAPEQILTSSIRSLWCAEARARGRHPSAGSARSSGSTESIEEWEDTEEQTGQTLIQTWSLCNTFWGQGNLHLNDEGCSSEFI